MKEFEDDWVVIDEVSPPPTEVALFMASGKTQRFMLNASLTTWPNEKVEPQPRRKTKANRKKSKAARKARRKNR